MKNSADNADSRQHRDNPIKVLIIASKRSGIAARQERIARSLDRGGFETTILAWDRSGALSHIERIGGFEVINFRFRTTERGGPLGLALGYVFWYLFVTRHALRRDVDIYHPENLYSLIPIILTNFIKRRKIVYDLVDFVATSFAWSAPIMRTLAFIENRAICLVDAVIVMDLRKQSITPGFAKIIVEIPNSPEDSRELVVPKVQEEIFTIYYGGWVTKTRGIAQLCEAIREMQDVRLYVAGALQNGNELPADQNNVKYVGVVSNLESLELTASADLLFAFYDPRIPINRLAVSAKIPEAMMLGKPILANSESTLVREILEKEGCGIVVPYDDVVGIRTAISTLKENTSLAQEMGRRGRLAFEREYNWNLMEKRLLTLYQRVIDNARITSGMKSQ